MGSAAFENSVNTFRKCGIDPYDVNIFSDSEFILRDEPENTGGEVPTIPAVDEPVPKYSSHGLLEIGLKLFYHSVCIFLLLCLLQSVQGRKEGK
jgi:hypothetical protein